MMKRMLTGVIMLLAATGIAVSLVAQPSPNRGPEIYWGKAWMPMAE